MIIGITGPICAGKNSVSKILEEYYGYIPKSFSEEVRLEAYARGIEPTRKNLQRLGADLKEQQSKDYWSRRILGRLSKRTGYVVDGFRSSEEVQAFRSFGDFILLGVSASFDVRFQRYVKRAREGDDLSIEAFRKVDSFDKGEDGSRSSESALVYRSIDHEITNDGKEEELRLRVETFMSSISG